MGNNRFRLSAMIPNAWFYKLKDTSKSDRPTKKNHQHNTSSSSSASSSSNIAAPDLSSKQGQQPHLQGPQRKSYYFTRDLSAPPPANDHDHTFYCHNAPTADTRISPPTKSSKKKSITTRRNVRAISQSPSPRLVNSSVSAGCICRATLESVWTTSKPDSTTPEDYPNSPVHSSSDNESLAAEFCSSLGGVTPPETTLEGAVSCSASCRSRVNSDTISGEPPPPVHCKLSSAATELLHLSPIITKPKACSKDIKEGEGNRGSCRLRRRSSSAKFEERHEYGAFSVKVVKEDMILSATSSNSSSGTSKTCNSFREQEQKRSNIYSTTSPAPARRYSISSSSPVAGGLKLRTNSPRIANKRIPIQSRKSRLSRRRKKLDSFAVVKSSKDPQRDFRESMVEMIVENNICASKDLEDLLACYLSLNSDRYHDLIIKVFKQIWFDFVDLHTN